MAMAMEVAVSVSAARTPFASPARLHCSSSTRGPSLLVASSSVSVPVSASVSVSAAAMPKGPKRGLALVRRSAPSPEQHQAEEEEKEVRDPGVKVALSLLLFYKTQISPFLPRSCRYVPTCSEYSMEAYKKYGFLKGSILTAYRICRCNPFGGYGFDPPRWFGEGREGREEPPSDL